MKVVNIIVIDFFDSFTWNIVSECKQLFKDIIIKVCPWNKLDITMLSDSDKQILIWGPGPGKPEEYHDINFLMAESLIRKNIYNMGICLGHQMLMMNQGFELERASRPRHGESVMIKIPAWDNFALVNINKRIKVQLYNSWMIKMPNKLSNHYKLLLSNNEIMGFTGIRQIGYQFHPESIGTSASDIFFHPIKQFMEIS